MSYCKLCGSQEIRQCIEREPVAYKGSTLQVAMEYSECQECGREFVATEQIRRNDAAVRDAKRHHDGLLTGEEIVRLRKSFHLNQEMAAVLFGGGRHAFSKYERGEVTQSASMDRLLRLCYRHPELIEELKALNPAVGHRLPDEGEHGRLRRDKTVWATPTDAWETQHREDVEHGYSSLQYRVETLTVDEPQYG
ncbi:type II toxin-antitoxin system MqsA family antitoxin [Aidingimonas halophila]|uniref:HTH-type transcriptional regulator / antitoxin MqsA n=1 Tax=Aidingimonas halophila TaxID=574349 RepID=A0A1H3CR74_9GAMM|nr:type II toxin-antitoxin system MqsA family antitoxin [Aidingimonas halophila]GHC35109.1 hypothetical protein GCM10008094_30250 [Aidingimonas halophila]SDX56044.1 HTH-type transcriptional regulator / antitoxin MqsA [Aidingimonas halophila]